MEFLWGIVGGISLGGFIGMVWILGRAIFRKQG